MTASCAVEVTNGECFVSLTGEVDLHNAEVIVEWLRLAVDVPGCRRVEVDLSSLDFLDGQGISSLLRGHGYAQARGVGFKVKQPQLIVARALNITGADRVLGLC
jgi:anti-anti-sigma factor